MPGSRRGLKHCTIHDKLEIPRFIQISCNEHILMAACDTSLSESTGIEIEDQWAQNGKICQILNNQYLINVYQHIKGCHLIRYPLKVAQFLKV